MREVRWILVLCIFIQCNFARRLIIDKQGEINKPNDCVHNILGHLIKLLDMQESRNQTSNGFFSYLLNFNHELISIFETCQGLENNQSELQQRLLHTKRDVFWMKWIKSLKINSSFEKIIQTAKNADSSQFNTFLKSFIKSFQNLLSILILQSKLHSPTSIIFENPSDKENPDLKDYYKGLFEGLHIINSTQDSSKCTGDVSLIPVETPSIFYLTSQNATKAIELFSDALPVSQGCMALKYTLTNWLLGAVEDCIDETVNCSAKIYQNIDFNTQLLQLDSNLYQADFQNSQFYDAGHLLGEIFSILFRTSQKES